MLQPLFAQIVLPIPVDHPFTYAVPESLRARAREGMRAVVPVLNRVETGYITGLAHESDVERPKDLMDLPDEDPVFSKAMLDLCRWIADYYCCSWGEALQCAAPAGLRMGRRMRYRLTPDWAGTGRLTERQAAILAELHEHGPRTEGQLATVAGRKALSNTLQSLVRRGAVLAEPLLRETGVSIRAERWAKLVEDRVLDTAGLMQLQRRAPKQAAVYLDLLHGQSERAVSPLLEKHGASFAAVEVLARKGLVTVEEREFYRAPDYHEKAHGGQKFALNADQAAAHEAILRALETRQFQTFLLHGITGSGKTEVYLQAIEVCLAQGRDAIMLVPEISLTPQTVGRFHARFHEQIAVLHSGLSAGERYDEWRRALRGEVRIVVGARSAVFAPLANLGMIVADEEHDTSYKQAETPRYHARDVAIMRAKISHAVCVLGSATPSIESYRNSETGKSHRLDLPKRATRSALPEVRIVDMRAEAREMKGQIILSRTLEEAVRARIAAREQVILLLNRRGHSPFVLCPKCGWVAQCDNCNVSLTYHSHGAALRCHYCNAEHPRPGVCRKCHFNPLLYLGMGTQKAEEYLMRTFSGARVERMDADTTSGKGGHAKILGRFAEGEIDLLIGTQMLAKGHDYPGVTLVGVIHGDAGLSIPDFRAAEQTFQLLTQVAGRAGRGGKAGEVYIQTYRPKHYAVRAAETHDYASFYRQEVAFRESAGYPPFRRMAHFTVESEDPALAERHAMILHRVVRGQVESLGFSGVQLLGPAPATIKRVNTKYRWNLGALSRSAQRLNELVRAARAAFQSQAAGKVQLKIDLDPYGMF